MHTHTQDKTSKPSQMMNFETLTSVATADFSLHSDVEESSSTSTLVPEDNLNSERKNINNTQPQASENSPRINFRSVPPLPNKGYYFNNSLSLEENSNSTVLATKGSLHIEKQNTLLNTQSNKCNTLSSPISIPLQSSQKNKISTSSSAEEFIRINSRTARNSSFSATPVLTASSSTSADKSLSSSLKSFLPKKFTSIRKRLRSYNSSRTSISVDQFVPTSNSLPNRSKVEQSSFSNHLPSVFFSKIHQQLYYINNSQEINQKIKNLSCIKYTNTLTKEKLRQILTENFKFNGTEIYSKFLTFLTEKEIYLFLDEKKGGAFFEDRIEKIDNFFEKVFKGEYKIESGMNAVLELYFNLYDDKIHSNIISLPPSNFYSLYLKILKYCERCMEKATTTPEVIDYIHLFQSLDKVIVKLDEANFANLNNLIDKLNYYKDFQEYTFSPFKSKTITPLPLDIFLSQTFQAPLNLIKWFIKTSTPLVNEKGKVLNTIIDCGIVKTDRSLYRLINSRKEEKKALTSLNYKNLFSNFITTTPISMEEVQGLYEKLPLRIFSNLISALSAEVVSKKNVSSLQRQSLSSKKPTFLNQLLNNLNAKEVTEQNRLKTLIKRSSIATEVEQTKESYLKSDIVRNSTNKKVNSLFEWIINLISGLEKSDINNNYTKKLIALIEKASEGEMQQEALKEVPFSALPPENYVSTCKLFIDNLLEIGKSVEVEEEELFKKLNSRILKARNEAKIFEKQIVSLQWCTAVYFLIDMVVTIPATAAQEENIERQEDLLEWYQMFSNNSPKASKVREEPITEVIMLNTLIEEIVNHHKVAKVQVENLEENLPPTNLSGENFTLSNLGLAFQQNSLI